MIAWLKSIIKKSWEVFFPLLKIIVPIMLILEVLKYFSFIAFLGEVLAPLMLPLGLPGEMGIVWATALTLNLYNALAVFFSLITTVETLTVSQVTVLMSIALIAHSLPIEQKILKLVGLKMIPSTLFRILFAYIYGFALNFFYSQFSLLSTLNQTNTAFALPIPNSLSEWLINTLQFLGVMFVVILTLMAFIDILEKLKIDKVISFFLAKLLKPISISSAIIPTMLIGVLLGISYGGGLLVKEIKKKNLEKLDIIKVMLFLSLSHSLIEDTLLILTTGAHYSGILLGRVAFTFGVLIILQLLNKNIKFFGKKVERVFYYQK